MTSTIKLVLKEILFYTTIITVFVFMASVDSLYDKGYIFPSLLIVASLLFACHKTLRKKISFNKNNA